MNENLRKIIGAHLNAEDVIPHSVSGGSINDAWHLQAGNDQFFCKVNSLIKYPELFQKEVAGLDLIRAANVIRVPENIQTFQHGDTQVLVMEWIEPGLESKEFWQRFGSQLAELHNKTNQQCGLKENNYLGSIWQDNQLSDNWPDFFRERRLIPMVERNKSSGTLDASHLAQFESLYTRLHDIFSHECCLLHGDLWNGNFLVNRESQPVLIDPAVYYGHRCIDLGMTKLFGGFDKEFYLAYKEASPLDPNFREQCNVCNLYPLLVHLELFGRSYLGQIETILRRYS